ncbi:Sulfite exporter TauE/SafE family protein [Raphanus sativus]|uniref:Sulfite exporter TauE/SafE family protein 5 n=1 Tax=Raphanus sativus TaxID=3726 RepID=A0A6J0MD09_RAPSA|nr:sulfite exporter TauE/SafE family protein 5 [Raphanus sativus]KAJ4912797.1 Sulfite exporter TauE/SafE family protein [Raphanus sativus]
MKTFFVFLLLLVCALAINANQQEENQPIIISHKILHRVQQWRTSLKESSAQELKLSSAIIVAGVLCFMAALISSAGGIGGGGLFIPIMTIVAGFDLKTASSFSAFMVTGGSIANVISNLFGGKPLLDYDLALLLEPCMLLGVSIGVICNRVLPEWLITVLFAVFLAWSSLKTCRNGVKYWKIESDVARGKGHERPEKGQGETEEDSKSLKAPLLEAQENRNKTKLPWTKLGVLIVVWASFFVIYLLRGNKDGKGIITIKPCGVEYWILLSLQIPLALVFTKLALSRSDSLQERSSNNQKDQEGTTRLDQSTRFMFPVMSFLAGLLGGIFGIGGGMLISPLLLQAGIPPQITAATTSFMVFFSATMSAVQYLLLGMQNTEAAYIFSLICFFASLLGLVLVQKAVAQFGRASIIVFSVGTVMSLSTVLMTSFGALDVWTDYVAGKDMGFKLPC